MKKRLALAVTAFALMSVAACSSSGTTTATSGSTPTSATSTPTATASATASDAPFGAGCSAVPTDSSNPGSFDSMSKVPVATAASGNPVLKTLVAAVTAAGLGDTLNNAPALTVFAPDNDAFAKIPATQLTAVLANKAMLTKILEYHVVQGKIAPDQLAGTHATLEGGSVTIAGSGSDFKINGTSSVVCGNVQTANATVYIIDTVLTPPAS